MLLTQSKPEVNVRVQNMHVYINTGLCVCWELINLGFLIVSNQGLKNAFIMEKTDFGINPVFAVLMSHNEINLLANLLSVTERLWNYTLLDLDFLFCAVCSKMKHGRKQSFTGEPHVSELLFSTCYLPEA